MSEHGRMLFGTAGTPITAKERSTEAGIECVAELGLECMEVEFVYGVKMSEKAALSIGELAAIKGIALTVHGPYYINLNAVEPEKIEASKARILQSARIASLLGARSVTFHAAFYLKNSPAETYDAVKRNLEEVLGILRGEDIKVTISPEVTGKPSQFGSLEELLRLATELEGVAPCIDFSHWHARTGKANSYQEFIEILDEIGSRLGRPALDNMHVHVSGVEFGGKGERRHLMLSESDFNYIDLLRALEDRRAKGVIICESAPHLERDALLLQRAYNRLHG
jgi:deoxyribonuclease-4